MSLPRYELPRRSESFDAFVARLALDGLRVGHFAPRHRGYRILRTSAGRPTKADFETRAQIFALHVQATTLLAERDRLIEQSGYTKSRTKGEIVATLAKRYPREYRRAFGIADAPTAVTESRVAQ